MEPVQEIDVEAAVKQFYPLADWWANKIQWSEEDHNDLVQDGMVGLITTIRGYNRSGKEIRDLPALASSCFSAWMKWFYKKSDRSLFFVDLDKVKKIPEEQESPLDQIFIDEFLDKLELVHGVIARKIVEQLMVPGEEVREISLREMEEKKRQKEAGARVIGYGTPRVHRHHIRQSLGLDTKQWDVEIANIKAFTKEHLCQKKDSTNGHLKRASSIPRPSSVSPIADCTTASPPQV